MNINEVANYKPEFAASIFSGVIHCSNMCLETMLVNEKFKEWEPHNFKIKTGRNKDNDIGDSSIEYNKHLESVYYPGFINCFFPSKIKENEFSKNIRSYSKILNADIVFGDHTVHVEYLDLFCFPKNIIIYCFKCEMAGFTINDIITINYIIREMELGNIDFLSRILSRLSCDSKLNKGNKLKLFSIIEVDIPFRDFYGPEHLLFDIATCSPVGSVVGDGTKSFLKPSESYFKNILDQHMISVFDNWTALSLFDSFAVVFKGESYNNKWEFDYFRLLYIHSLFIKSYLVKISSEFQLGATQKNIENKFHEFNKHFNLKQISHNFLPQLIYDKIRSGLNIEFELIEIRQTIERDHKLRVEKSEKKMSRALFILAMLTVFTAISDGSAWLSQIIRGENGPLFNIITILAFLVVYSIVFILLIKRK